MIADPEPAGISSPFVLKALKQHDKPFERGKAPPKFSTE
jgi:hypothetical protein